MPFEHYIRSGQKLLRCGYTTGTCAALAAQGATYMLLTGKAPRVVSLLTPKGWEVTVPPAECCMAGESAICRVAKDAGDDCDTTDGLLVTATVNKLPQPGIVIDGGDGVGRVTKTGLDQPVGAAAINRVPRRMICEQAESVCRRLGYTGGLQIIISIPGGVEAARRTFNPNLGVEGGLSVLGTTGIVEPMSEQAIVDTISIEIRQNAAISHRLILTPGNYGTDFLHAQGWDTIGIPVVKCSNFIGDALDSAVSEQIEELLLVGHIGKFVKLAGGIMNTHSRYADCRTELFCAYAAVCGATPAVCQELLQSATTDACIAVLDKSGLRTPVLNQLLVSIQQHIARRVGPSCRIGAVVFSNQYGLLGQTETAKELLQQWQTQ